MVIEKCSMLLFQFLNGMVNIYIKFEHINYPPNVDYKDKPNVNKYSSDDIGQNNFTPYRLVLFRDDEHIQSKAETQEADTTSDCVNCFQHTPVTSNQCIPIPYDSNRKPYLKSGYD